MDTALISDGVVSTVWRGKSIDDVLNKLPPGEYDLIEVADDGGPADGPVICGQLWDGAELSNPPAPSAPPRLVAKSEVAGRLTAIGKAAAFRAAMLAAPAFELAWITPGLMIEADDADFLAALSAAGLTAEEVDTITA